MHVKSHQSIENDLEYAIAAGYFSKHWKISIFPILVMLGVLLVAPTLDAGTLLIPGIIASVLGAFVMWKAKIVK